jgi:hypothetical protein
VSKLFTTAYHPETDGPPERLNRFIANALYSLIRGDQRDWDLFLAAIAFAYRSSVIEGLGFSPFQLVLVGDQCYQPMYCTELHQEFAFIK